MAVLVDGENIRPDKATRAIERATMGHKVLIRRVYGRVEDARVWAEAHGYHGVFTLSNGAKNTADIALVIDAMELALRARVDGFVLATSDSDFTRLAAWLHENGFAVFGVGEGKTSARFRLSCSAFYEVQAAAVVAPSAPKAMPEASTPSPAVPRQLEPEKALYATMAQKLREQMLENGGSVRLSQINRLLQGQKGIHPMKSTKYGDWRTFIESRPNVFRIVGDGPCAIVEVKLRPVGTNLA
jgi:hypothetical protein